MNIAGGIKRAPKWAWFTVAGVGLGAAAIKLWKDRAAPDPTQVAADTIGTDQYLGDGVGTAGTPPGVIVPPVIIGAPANDGNLGVPQLQDLYVGAIGDIIGFFQGAASASQITPDQLLSALASGGGVPDGSGTVVSAPSVAQPPPQPLPPKASCPAAYSNYNPARGAVGPKSCWRDAGRDRCVSGIVQREHIHLYQNGDVVVTSRSPVSPRKKC